MPEFQLDYGSAEAAKAFRALDSFTQGYIEAMFFTETGTGDDAALEHATFADLHTSALAAIVEDCAAFQSKHKNLLDAAQQARDDYDATCAGRDFWYTRNGHGVGYWDRELGSVGDELSKRAKAAGSRYIYRSGDEIYVG